MCLRAAVWHFVSGGSCIADELSTDSTLYHQERKRKRMRVKLRDRHGAMEPDDCRFAASSMLYVGT